MIVKTRIVPNELMHLQSLMNRLHQNHPLFEQIQTVYMNVKSGIGGEQHFDYYLNEFKPEYPYAIVHDLRLKIDGVYVQIDSLLITPYTLFVFEVKNIAGKLTFLNEPNRFVRELEDGTTKPMNSPVEQVKRITRLLQLWLAQKNIQLPLHGVVVLAYAKELNAPIIPQVDITFAYQIPNYLHESQREKVFLTKEEVFQVATALKKAHREYMPTALCKRFNITPQNISPGVRCATCNYIGMIRKHSKWFCPKCRMTNRTSHLDTIEDWFALINDEQATNKDLRNFLQINNRHLIKRLMKIPSVQLINKGKNSYYIYLNK